MISCMYSKYRGSSTSLPVQGKDLRKEVLKRKSGIISPNDNIVPHLNLDDIETLRTPFYPAETLIIKETEDEYKSYVNIIIQNIFRERSLQHEKVNKIADLEINPNREEKHEEYIYMFIMIIIIYYIEKEQTPTIMKHQTKKIRVKSGKEIKRGKHQCLQK